MSGKVKVLIKKLHASAQVPTAATSGSGACDLSATSTKMTDEYVEYGTGLAIAIPTDYVGLVFPRSSVSNKGWALANGVGVIDSDYRGEIKLRFYDVSSQSQDLPYVEGDRIGQLLLVPRVDVQYVDADSLPDTERGAGGFGSTDAPRKTPPGSRL